MNGVEKLWNDLNSLNGDEVAERTAALYRGGVYTVPFLDRELTVDPESRRVTVSGTSRGDVLLSNHVTLAILSFLVSGELRTPVGTWINEKQLPGGSLFFQGPHKMPVAPVIDKFGKASSAFIERGLALGGQKTEFGDSSVEFTVLPGLQMCIVLWEEDDEFPAECTVMFDRSFKGMFALDVVLGLTSAVVELIVADESGN